MSFWFLIQILVNIILFGVVGVLWMKLSRPQKDDPRMSKGLQLLQSKISVLEDLSDRTETQVQQLTALIENKVKDVQSKIQSADKQLAKIEQATQKSLEVAKIFQDRIPHDEILERKNSIKYIKAARLAHQGLSPEEISKQVDLSRGEIEFIAKVNKDQLMFCEQSLPDWAQDDSSLESPEDNEGVDEISFMPPIQRGIPRDLSSAFEIPKPDTTALKKLGEAFKAACEEVPQEIVDEKPTKSPQGFLDLNEELSAQQKDDEKKNRSAIRPANLGRDNGRAKEEKIENSGIRPVEFRRIELVKDLE